MSAPLRTAELLRKDRESREDAAQQMFPNGSASSAEVSSAAQLLHSCFEEQVLRSPYRVAAAFEGKELTYETLNQQANRLAHYLRRFGAGPEVLVGLCVERSLEMLVGILGILKAGAAYVPMDPSYPPERLAFMLADAQVKLLVTQEHLVTHFSRLNTTVICLDRDREAIEREPADNPAASALPENPAYVIYTSGSTGTPKGVVVTHRNVLRLFGETRHWFGFSPQDVWTLFHSFAFDFSVWEIWGALLHGGRVVIVPYFVSRTPEAFYDLLCREQVTILNQTPSAFRQLIRAEEALAQYRRTALRLVIFGGEALQLQSLKPWIERHGDQNPQLVNMFGITETTVHVTYRRILRQDVEGARGSVIGCPIPDLQAYICDKSLHPLGRSEAGELYVSGEGVTRGYLDRPDLTAERFVPDPFSAEPGSRLYRTGDMARNLPGDDLEYLGRADQQVKVRGFRIELGEIENVLAQHPAVEQCVVIARDHEEDGKRLLAYVVLTNDRLSSQELHIYLQQKLPDYMLPAAIVVLQELPLTSHGKLDRSALPAPRPDLKDAAEPRTPAATLVENTLADVWMESLELSAVGVDDNYFALGGDSIRSIKVRAKALERGLSFSLQQLFQNPTIRKLAAVISDDAGKKLDRAVSRDCFSMISEQDRHRLPSDAEDAYPVSPLQAGMIFHSDFSPDYIIYVSSLHLHIRFDVAKMQEALQLLAARHEMLRTSFDMKTFCVPLQIVHKGVRPELHVEDLRHLSPAGQQQHIDEWLLSETRRKFNWSCAPLVRFTVHLRDDDRIQFTMSEPFLDGWSVASLLTEIFTLYNALLLQASAPQERLAGSYKDFVVIEQEALKSEECRRYWAKVLAAGSATRLPYRKAAAFAGPREVARLDVPLSKQTSDRLNEVARRAGVSLKSVLLAAHMKVLSILSGQSEGFTGMLINGRPESRDGERLIGAFLNTVPFRMQFGSENWIEIARKAHALENEMLPFRRYPIQEMQRLHEAEKKFDTIFNFTHFHVMSRLQAIPGLEILEVRGSEQTYYALTAQFSINEFSSRIELALDYRTLEIEEEQVKDIAGYYARVLEAIAADPLVPHDSLCFLPEQERQSLVVQRNQTRAAFAEHWCLHELFEAQARKTPDAPAIVFGEQRLAYADLERRANQLARYLRNTRVGPETLVGICMERGLSMIVGLLGILKAGGAYVPLDPQYPRQRLDFMRHDARLKLILTQRHLLDRIVGHESRLVCLDADWAQVERESSASLISHTHPGNLAYVIYTSGSTGEPKGVLIEHRAVVNTIEASIKQFAVQGGSRVVQLGSLSFDVSVLEIFTTLLSGGTLYLADRETLMPGQELGRFLRENAITTMAIPPSLLDLIPPEDYPALKTIILGGEACSPDTAAQWSGGRDLFNAYAPTEATIYATTMLCSERLRERPPIGKPIQNMRVYLLDEHQQPVPPAVPGELYIGGVGVSRGYLNRPALTAEKFIPDPFSLEPGARLYRTGDLARVLPDGNIHFLGRTDQQVKVRGFRIELGEIEVALGAHSEVGEVAVVAREDTSNEKRIVAYIVPHQGSGLQACDLRAHLKSRVPEYMLPSAFVMLDSMPLSETGKIDRASLPAPEQLRPELSRSYVAPRSALEKVLVGTFSDVLRIEPLGVLDSFFELGGHSLVATQAVSRIRQLLGIDLPLRTIFEEPTVDGLAAAIVKRETEPANVERAAELVLHLSQLSEEEASSMLQSVDLEPRERTR